MGASALSAWVMSCLLVGLRVVPVFAFAPPFTLVRIPATFRVLFGLGLAVALVSGSAISSDVSAENLGAVVVDGLRELGLGIVIMLAFQLVFGALYVAGRTIDIQAGYGLALLIDPTSQAQTPLAGTLFAYAAGALFFAMKGHVALVRLFAASYDAVPLGTWIMPHTIARLAAFMGTAFLSALGVAGGVILVLFLVDTAIALISRTVPQMNVLILGFQVKTIVFLLALPASFAVGGVVLARLMAATLDTLPRLI